MSNDIHELIMQYAHNFSKLKDLDKDLEQASNKSDIEQINSQQKSNKE